MEPAPAGSGPFGRFAAGPLELNLLALAAMMKLSRAEFLAGCEQLYETLQKEKERLKLTELEKLALNGVMQIGLMALASTVKEHPLRDPDQEFPCERCKKPMRIQEKAQKNTLPTTMGKFEYTRPYCVCDRCGISYAPLDRAMGIPVEGPSILTCEKICQASVTTHSFGVASKNLKGLAHVEMAPKEVRAVAEEEGRILMEGAQGELKKYQAGQLEGAQDGRVDFMVVCADGGRVQSREGFADWGARSDSCQSSTSQAEEEAESRWKEDKVGVVYDAKAQPNRNAGKLEDYEGAKAEIKTYVATMKPWEDFGWMLRVEAEKRGYAGAKQKVFLGDGAKNVREVQEMHFSDAVFILDWAHALGHLSEFSKAAFWDEDPDRAVRWYQRHKQMLWDGQVDEIIEPMQRISRQRGEPRQGDPSACPRVILNRNAFSYFPNNKKAMDYPRFRALGFPIGSGVVEAGVKQFGKRLKGSEKFWNVVDSKTEATSDVTGAEEMLALCALYFSEDGRWERHWKWRADVPYSLRR